MSDNAKGSPAEPQTTPGPPEDDPLLLAEGQDPEGGPEGFPDWEMEPVAPPGLEDYMPTFLGWLWWICMPIGIIAVAAAGVMMAVGRFGGRGAVAADGLRQFVWACVGVAVITLSIPIVTGLFSI